MKAVVQQRARIARVRRVQHMQAAAAAVAAEGHLVHLERNDQRLASLRGSLECAPGMSTGASLSGAAELALRLDQARAGLAEAIAVARAAAAERAEQRIEARRRKESADKLDNRAATALARLIEQRASAGGPRRTVLTIVGDEE